MIKHSAAISSLRAVAILLLALSVTACASWPRSGADPAAIKQRANAAYAAERWADAARGYRTYLESVPTDPHAWYRLGNAEARRGRLRQAESAYYSALDAAPAMTRASHNLGLVQARLAWRSLMDARQALSAHDASTREAGRLLTCLADSFSERSQARDCPPPNPTEEGS